MRTLFNSTCMNRILLGTAAFLFGLVSCFGQIADTFSLGPNKQIATASFQIWKPEKVKAIFIITPGFGLTPGCTDLKELNEWKQFASANGLALMFVDFTITSPNPQQAKDTEFNPIDGMADIVNEGITREFKSNLPAFLYGRNDQSTRHILSMIDPAPDNFIGWCCNGPDFFKLMPHLTKATPPGIITCTTDCLRYDVAKKFFVVGRNAKNKWTWLSSRSIDSPKFRDFIRQYFISLMGSSIGQWRDANTRQVIESNVADNDPENTVWLPDSSIGDTWATLQADRPDKPIIIEKEVDLSGHNLPNIQLYLRIPNGAKDASGVDGVLAYCTWTKERDTLVQQLSNDTDQPEEKIEYPSVQMLRFAAKHNLAVLTWSTPGEWSVDDNESALSEKDKLAVNRQFDLFAGAWEKGVSELCSEYKLPQDKYLLWGMSRGAQWAHRLALSDPKRFLAVNVHVAGSYGEPTEEGKNCLWLITSGELDPGLNHSKDFYASCQKLGYPILIKAPLGLGHEMRSDVDTIRNAFFEYALSVKNEIGGSDSSTANLITLQNAKYVGDYVTQKVVTPDKADQIAPENQVYLPTEEFAHAWQTPQPGQSTLTHPLALDSASNTSLNTSSTNTISVPVTPSEVAVTTATNTVESPVDVTNKPRTATVITPTKIEALTPNGGHASIPLDHGAKLTIISINADGTITAVTDSHFQGQVPQTCITIDKP